MLMDPMMASVVAAFRDCGYLNAGTPFEIASTPVSAVVPAANARKTRKPDRAQLTCRWVSALSASGHPLRHLTNPVPSNAAIEAMNR